jgi:hypothetical protein
MKLPKEPHTYGSAFEALKDLDQQLEKTEQLLDAKIQAVSDLLHKALKRIEELDKKTPTGKGGKGGSKD